MLAVVGGSGGAPAHLGSGPFAIGSGVSDAAASRSPSPAATELPSATGATWTNLTAYLRPAPAARSDPAFASDPSAGTALLFGGHNGSTVYGDTWLYENSTWVPETPLSIGPTDSPSPRWGAAMTFDPADGAYLLFGGRNAGAWLNDTWLWKDGTWTEVPTGPAPAARSYASLADVPTAPWNAPILFGGNALLPFNDTWEFANDSWTNLTPTLPTAPSPRYGAGAAYDPDAGALIVFGGYDDPSTGGTGALADTWAFGAGGWTRLATALGPSARLSPVAVFAPTLGGLLLYGGINPQGARLGDLWALSNSTWTEVSPSENLSLAARSGAGAGGLDPDGTWSMVLFGGAFNALYNGNDTWVYGAPPPLGVAGPVAPRTTIDVGQSLAFSAFAYGGTPPYSYAWAFDAAICPSVDAASTNCTPVVPPADLGRALLVRVTVNDSNGSSVTSSPLELFVNPAVSAELTFTPPTTVPTVGATLTIAVEVTGGTAPYTFAMANLPPGCAASRPGTFQCVLTTPGVYNVSAHVTDDTGAATDSNAETLFVSAAPASGSSPNRSAWVDAILVGGGVGAVGVAAAVAYWRQRPKSPAAVTGWAGPPPSGPRPAAGGGPRPAPPTGGSPPPPPR